MGLWSGVLWSDPFVPSTTVGGVTRGPSTPAHLSRTRDSTGEVRVWGRSGGRLPGRILVPHLFRRRSTGVLLPGPAPRRRVA